MGVNPVKLMFSLNQSFYKKFSNVLGDYDESAERDDRVFPSQMNYNFEKIQKYQQDRDRDVEDAVILDEETNDKDVEKGKKVKLTLAEKIKRKREALNKKNSDIEANTDVFGKNKGKANK